MIKIELEIDEAFARDLIAYAENLDADNEASALCIWNGRRLDRDMLAVQAAVLLKQRGVSS